VAHLAKGDFFPTSQHPITDFHAVGSSPLSGMARSLHFKFWMDPPDQSPGLPRSTLASLLHPGLVVLQGALGCDLAFSHPRCRLVQMTLGIDNQPLKTEGSGLRRIEGQSPPQGGRTNPWPAAGAAKRSGCWKERRSHFPFAAVFFCRPAIFLRRQDFLDGRGADMRDS